MKRQRSKHETSFHDRLTETAQRLREEANKVPHGTARDLLLRRARQADTASHIDDWLSSPGLQSPK